MSKILVVDDDAAIRQLLTRTLSRQGHEVQAASNGKEAVWLLGQAILPDLVITDLIMPEQEGIETIMIIREKYPDVKIIATSGGGTRGATDYLADASAMGVDATLSKPFTMDELKAVVDGLLPPGR